MFSILTNTSLSQINRILTRDRLFKLLPWIVLIAFLVLTYQLSKNAQTEADFALETEFQFRSEEATQKIAQRMMSYDHMLRGAQGLFATYRNINRNEFRDYVKALDLEKSYPGMQGLGYTLLLPKANKDKHIAAVRSEGFPEYSIHPEGVREVYASVLYVEPFSRKNLQVFGYDNFSDPDRRLSLETARDTGLGTISAKIKLLQETDTKLQDGFLMWRPVYKTGVSLVTLAERRSALTGWVGASFRLDDLMANIFAEQNRNTLAIEIFDGKEMTAQALIYDSVEGGRKHLSTSESYYKKSHQLNFAGRTWTILFSSLTGSDESINNQKSHLQKPRLIAIAGVIVSILLALITGMLVYSRARALRFVQMLNQELSERKLAAAGMKLAEKVFESVDAAVLVTDAHTRIIKVNPAFTTITGYSSEEAIGKTPRMLSSGAHSLEFYKEMWSTLKATGSWQGEIFNRRKNGEFFTEWLSIKQVHDNEGKLTNYVSLFSDISKRKAAEEHMHNLAHYDPLTGLPNRTLFTDRLQQAIVAAKRDKLRMALMFIDLDKFKPVNDTHGHPIGDLLLKEVAKRILECLRESDSAARVGGDEFVVLLPIIEAVSDAVAVAEKIRHALNQPFMIAVHQLNISSSIGVAVYPEHGSIEKSLLKNADTAMYAAKEAGRNNVMLYEPMMSRQ